MAMLNGEQEDSVLRKDVVRLLSDIEVYTPQTDPLGPFGVECAQHRRTPRPSVERIRRKALEKDDQLFSLLGSLPSASEVPLRKSYPLPVNPTRGFWEPGGELWWAECPPRRIQFARATC